MGMFSHDEEPSWSDIFSLQKQIMKIRENNTTLEAENTKLKELLKECREVIKNVDTYYGNYDAANGYLVINKIDEVLK